MASSLALIGRVRALKRIREQVRRERRERRERKRQAAAGPQHTTDSVLVEYANDPVGFARDWLGYELEIQLPEDALTNARQTPGWCTYQADIARAVLEHSKVAVRSGHKLGKSLVAVIIAIWWVCTREEGRAVLTAATDRQVRRVLWRELRNVHRRLKKRGVAILPEPKLDPATGCQWPDGREIIGFATKVPENAAGFSGPALLFVLDEGSGIPTEIYEAFAGNMAGGAKLLALSNPTQTTGWFFEAFEVRRDFWHQIHLSIEDSPNYRAGAAVVPGLATRDYEAEIAEAYGKDSAFYQVRVAGNFPKNVPNAVIGLGMVEAAREAWDPEAIPESRTLDIGVDVARFGDDFSAACARRGLTLYTPAFFEREHGIPAAVNGYDSKKVAGMALQVMRSIRQPGERVRIKIDAAGGYGGGVADELRAQKEAGELDEFIEIIEVNVSVKSAEPEKYPQLRDELWFGGRAWFKAGGAMYPDAKLESELIAPIYAPTAGGQFKVESKAETKKRLGRSPDRADAALLAIYEAVESFDVPQKQLPAMSRWGLTRGRGFGAAPLQYDGPSLMASGDSSPVQTQRRADRRRKAALAAVPAHRRRNWARGSLVDHSRGGRWAAGSSRRLVQRGAPERRAPSVGLLDARGSGGALSDLVRRSRAGRAPQGQESDRAVRADRRRVRELAHADRAPHGFVPNRPRDERHRLAQNVGWLAAAVPR
jgi:phage terminase large subunit